jgi:hypothetical protein
MWHGFDPAIVRDLATIRDMVSRQRQVPTKEWPLVYVNEYDVLLVVREWPDGSVTAYAVEHTQA